MDHYSAVARVVPMLITISPIATFAWSFVGDGAWSTLAVLLGGPVALSVLLAELGRDLGRSKQSVLWRKWGGAPATRLLRHSDDSVSPEIKARRHATLGRLRGAPLPTRDDEARDPETADAAYDACVQILISRTRSKTDFPLIYKENVSYGFRRNLWGLKPIGIGVASSTLIAATFIAAMFMSSPRFWIAASYSGIIALLWLTIVTSDWVRTPAEAYGLRISEACETLSEREGR